MVLRPLIAPLVALVLVGCGHAEQIRRDASGGVIALRGAQDLARADAEKQMAGQCGPDYEVVQEEVVPVGYSAKSRTTIRGHQHTELSESTELRLTYRCGRADAEASLLGPGLRGGTSSAGGAPSTSVTGAKDVASLQVLGRGEIYLDGAATGQAAPALLTVKPGVHEIELRTPTHLGNAKVTARIGETVAVRPAVNRLRVFTLKLTTIPAGAEVSLDGRTVGVTPLELPEVEAGTHRLRVLHPEARLYEAVRVLSADEPELRLPLQDPPEHQLRVMLPLVFEYDRRIVGGFWVGPRLSASLGASNRAAAAAAQLTLLARLQTSTETVAGAGVFAGAGYGLVNRVGKFVGPHLSAGVEGRLWKVTLSAEVQYYLFGVASQTESSFLDDGPWALQPMLGATFSF